jgi:mono/diheme cytochrome c family protein
MDLKSYLDTLPEVSTANVAHDLKFPWNVRSGIGFWKLLNLDSAPVVSVPEENDVLMRGRYLVEGPGHCGECHTPRNWNGGLDNSRWLAGAPNPDGEGKVSNITPGENGLSDWSADDIEYYLEWSRYRKTWRACPKRTAQPWLLISKRFHLVNF